MSSEMVLLVKGRAGLGNRILSLLTAVLYARLTRRHLLVDWSDDIYSSDGTNSIHDFFRSHLFSRSDEIPETESVAPAIWRGHLRDSARTMVWTYLPRCLGDPMSWRKFSADLSRIDHQEEVLVMWTYFPLINEQRRHFRGEFSYLCKLDEEAILSRLMRENLDLDPSIQEGVTRTRAGWPARPTVGVHVRHTDKRSRLDAIQARVGKLLAAEPELQVFLSTDNRDVEEEFRRAYPGLLTAPKWYPDEGQRAMHGSPGCPDKKANGVEALTDLYLLAGCDRLILDKSSAFSYVASLLSDQPPERIHDLQRWSALPPRLRHGLWRFGMSLKWGPRRLWTRLGV